MSNEVSKEQIEQYKKEMETYPIKKKKLFILAMIFFGVATLFIIALIIVLIVGKDPLGGVLFILSMVFAILFIIAGIAVLIFRYEIFLLKEANRKRIINRVESIEREQEHPHSKDDKIGF